MGLTSIRRFRQIQVENGEFEPDENHINNEKNIEDIDVPNAQEQDQDYSTMTEKQLNRFNKDELKEYLDKRNVSYDEDAKKADLINIVRTAQAPSDEEHPDDLENQEPKLITDDEPNEDGNKEEGE